MNQFTTRGIVLARVEFGEADRIITFLTVDHGKLRAMARGVRKSRSKLAGGIELFSVSDLTLIRGRGEIYTLISTRLQRHFGSIASQLERSQAGFAILKLINRATEDQTEPAYFELVVRAFEALNELEVEPALTKLWFEMQLLKLSGHAPNLKTDIGGQPLAAGRGYAFHYDKMALQPSAAARAKLSTEAIKFLRLGFGDHTPKALQRIENLDQLVAKAEPLIQTLLRSHLRT